VCIRVVPTALCASECLCVHQSECLLPCVHQKSYCLVCIRVVPTTLCASECLLPCVHESGTSDYPPAMNGLSSQLAPAMFCCAHKAGQVLYAGQGRFFMQGRQVLHARQGRFLNHRMHLSLQPYMRCSIDTGQGKPCLLVLRFAASRCFPFLTASLTPLHLRGIGKGKNKGTRE
jgi:hypothetical protein